MSSLQMPVARAAIDRAVEQIVEHFCPRQVLLFGSHAYGQPTSDSDVDLLVIMETQLRPVDQTVAIRETVQFPFPVDLLVRTPDQINERLKMGDSFFEEIFARGIVLYEAADARVDREG